MFLLKEKTGKVVYVSDDDQYSFDEENFERVEIKDKTREEWLIENNIPTEGFGEHLESANVIHSDEKPL